MTQLTVPLWLATEACLLLPAVHVGLAVQRRGAIRRDTAATADTTSAARPTAAPTVGPCRADQDAGDTIDRPGGACQCRSSPPPGTARIEANVPAKAELEGIVVAAVELQGVGSQQIVAGGMKRTRAANYRQAVFV